MYIRWFFLPFLPLFTESFSFHLPVIARLLSRDQPLTHRFYIIYVRYYIIDIIVIINI